MAQVTATRTTSLMQSRKGSATFPTKCRIAATIGRCASSHFAGPGFDSKKSAREWFLPNARVIEGDRTLLRDVPPDILDPPPLYAGKWVSVNMDVDRNVRFDLGTNFNDFISFAAAMFNAVATYAAAFEDNGSQWEMTAKPPSHVDSNFLKMTQ